VEGEGENCPKYRTNIGEKGEKSKWEKRRRGVPQNKYF
jgi:hypothetical protein